MEGGGINREKRGIMEKNESTSGRTTVKGEKKKMARFSLAPLRLSRGAFDRY